MPEGSSGICVLVYWRHTPYDLLWARRRTRKILPRTWFFAEFGPSYYIGKGLEHPKLSRRVQQLRVWCMSNRQEFTNELKFPVCSLVLVSMGPAWVLFKRTLNHAADAGRCTGPKGRYWEQLHASLTAQCSKGGSKNSNQGDFLTTAHVLWLHSLLIWSQRIWTVLVTTHVFREDVVQNWKLICYRTNLRNQPQLTVVIVVIGRVDFCKE